MTGGQPYCEVCYKAATCPSCHVCGHIVDGDGVKIGDKGDLGGTERIYHTQCVRSGVLLMGPSHFMTYLCAAGMASPA